MGSPVSEPQDGLSNIHAGKSRRWRKTNSRCVSVDIHSYMDKEPGLGGEANSGFCWTKKSCQSSPQVLGDVSQAQGEPTDCPGHRIQKLAVLMLRRFCKDALFSLTPLELSNLSPRSFPLSAGLLLSSMIPFCSPTSPKDIL